MWVLRLILVVCFVVCYDSIILEECPQLQSVQSISGSNVVLLAISEKESALGKTYAEHFPAKLACSFNEDAFEVSFDFDEQECKRTNCSIQVYRNESYIFASTCLPKNKNYLQFLGLLLYDKEYASTVPDAMLASKVVGQFVQLVLKHRVTHGQGSWNYNMRRLVCPTFDGSIRSSRKFFPVWVIAPVAVFCVIIIVFLYYWVH